MRSPELGVLVTHRFSTLCFGLASGVWDFGVVDFEIRGLLMSSTIVIRIVIILIILVIVMGFRNTRLDNWAVTSLPPSGVTLMGPLTGYSPS